MKVTSPIFLQQASNVGKGEQVNVFSFRGISANPMLHSITCTGELVVESIYNGSPLTQTYNDLECVMLSIQADANTTIKVIGNTTQLYIYTPYSPVGYPNITTLNLRKCKTLTNLYCSYCANLTALDLSANTALTYLDCSYCANLTALDLSANTALTYLGCSNCANLTALDLSANTALTYLDCSNCAALDSIKYAAENSDVAASIASLITANEALDGTVYTNSAGTYYSTIADAATAAGWTIAQL